MASPMNHISAPTTAADGRVISQAATFPSQPSLDRLRTLGIRSVVVLQDRVVGTPFEAVLSRFFAGEDDPETLRRI